MHSIPWTDPDLPEEKKAPGVIESRSNGEDKIESYARRVLKGEVLSNVLHGAPHSWISKTVRKIGELVPALIQAGETFDPKAIANLSEAQFRSILRPAKGVGDELFALVNLVPEAYRYDAHGIAKWMPADQIDSLVNLLEEGLDSMADFHTAPLRTPSGSQAGAGLWVAGGAYADGLFILISEKDQPLVKDKRLCAKTVLVNEAAYDMVPFLQARYPSIFFLRAKDIPEHYNVPHPLE